jgi:hypothetical protein
MVSERDIAGSQNPFSRHRGEFHRQPRYPARSPRWGASLIIFVSIGLVLSACSSASVIDSLPGAIGEPVDAPKRAAMAPEFPAVYDTPTPRAGGTLSAEEQKKAESELVAARESQKTGIIPPPPAVAATPAKAASQATQTVKKKPAAPAATHEATAGSGQKP